LFASPLTRNEGGEHRSVIHFVLEKRRKKRGGKSFMQITMPVLPMGRRRKQPSPRYLFRKEKREGERAISICNTFSFCIEEGEKVAHLLLSLSIGM